MDLNMIIFFFFSISLMVNSLIIILELNSIYSILLLVLAFVLATSLLILFDYGYIALIFIIIYVGAISVLFLFVIILLNFKITNSLKDLVKDLTTNNFLVLIFSLELFIILKLHTIIIVFMILEIDS
jgi:NADH:ubiquinone oxidoreductase subunit 6 (subunit J)